MTVTCCSLHEYLCDFVGGELCALNARVCPSSVDCSCSTSSISCFCDGIELL